LIYFIGVITEIVYRLFFQLWQNVPVYLNAKVLVKLYRTCIPGKSTSSEEEDQLENDELDSDVEAEILLDPSLQLGEWLNQLQVLSQGLDGLSSTNSIVVGSNHQEVEEESMKSLMPTTPTRNHGDTAAASFYAATKPVPPPKPSIDSYKYSKANLEESADVDLDALIGELCALESQLNAPEMPGLMMAGSKAASKDSCLGGSRHSRVSSDGSGPAAYAGDRVKAGGDVQARCRSPDTDSAYCDTMSILSESTQSSSNRSGESGGSTTDSMRGSMTTPSPTQLIEAVKAQIRNVKEEIQRENLTEAEITERLKNEKIKIALEKMKEASIKKLYVKIFTPNGQSLNMLIDERWSVAYVLKLLAEKHRLDVSLNHAIVEFYPDLYMERIYEDHEHLIENILMWTHGSPNKLFLMERRDKYHVFLEPEKYLLDDTHSDRNSPPELEGVLYLKSDGKKSWKKHVFVLRGSGLYYVPKGKSKSSRDLVRLMQFDVIEVYSSVGWKKKYKAPTDWGFALKHPQIQVKASKYIKYLCAEDERSYHKWLTGIRLAKRGQQLLENFEAQRNRSGVWSCVSMDSLTVSNSSSTTASYSSVHVNKAAGSFSNKMQTRSMVVTDMPVMVEGPRSGCDSPIGGMVGRNAAGAGGSDTKSICSGSTTDSADQGSLNAFETDSCTGTIKRRPSKASCPKIPLTEATKQQIQHVLGSHLQQPYFNSSAATNVTHDMMMTMVNSDANFEEEADSDEELPPPPPPLLTGNEMSDSSSSLSSAMFPPPPPFLMHTAPVVTVATTTTVVSSALTSGGGIQQQLDKNGSLINKSVCSEYGLLPAAPAPPPLNCYTHHHNYHNHQSSVSPTASISSSTSSSARLGSKPPPPPPPKRSDATKLTTSASSLSTTVAAVPVNNNNSTTAKFVKQQKMSQPSPPPHPTPARSNENAANSFHMELQQAMQKRLRQLEDETLFFFHSTSSCHWHIYQLLIIIIITSFWLFVFKLRTSTRAFSLLNVLDEYESSKAVVKLLTLLIALMSPPFSKLVVETWACQRRTASKQRNCYFANSNLNSEEKLLAKMDGSFMYNQHYYCCSGFLSQMRSLLTCVIVFLLLNPDVSLSIKPACRNAMVSEYCLYDEECAGLHTTCLGNTCTCPPDHEHYNIDGKMKVCRPAPALINATCQTRCKPPLVCSNNHCICWNAKRVGDSCTVDCPHGQTLIGQECKLAQQLWGICEVDSDCAAAFTECKNRRCTCVPGTVARGSNCVATCSDGSQPIRTCKKILQGLSDITENVQKMDTCPAGYYCATYGKPSIGHCCPLRCPFGEADTTKSCNKGSPLGSRCPELTTHFCHNFESGGYSAKLCCPRPCRNPTPYLINNRCYPVAHWGDACVNDEQCEGGRRMSCFQNRCRCNADFDQVNTTYPTCVRRCPTLSIEIAEQCYKKVKLAHQCFVDFQCPRNAQCREGRCECNCHFKPSMKACVNPDDPLNIDGFLKGFQNIFIG
ncbi:Abnormal cell migration protein 10, partial [Trichinella papuae]